MAYLNVFVPLDEDDEKIQSIKNKFQVSAHVYPGSLGTRDGVFINIVVDDDGKDKGRPASEKLAEEIAQEFHFINLSRIRKGDFDVVDGIDINNDEETLYSFDTY